MFVRSLSDVEKSAHYVEWGNGTSHRLLTASDDLSFGVCHTVVRAGSQSLLQYTRHAEACYCISGSGEVEAMDGTVHRIAPGVLYVLDNHDKHYLRADSENDMVLVSIFSPPLEGTERHNLSNADGSSY